MSFESSINGLCVGTVVVVDQILSDNCALESELIKSSRRVFCEQVQTSELGSSMFICSFDLSGSLSLDLSDQRFMHSRLLRIF